MQARYAECFLTRATVDDDRAVKLSRLLRILALTLAIPLGLVILLGIVDVLFSWIGANERPIVLGMLVLIYIVVGLGFVLIPVILAVMLLLTLGKLRRPGSPVPPRAG